ncbi:MAG: guanylate kinase [Syntrophaceae bacterium]
MRIFLSGPSGVGKSTIIQAILARHEDMRLSISYTTRSPRPGEQDGREYFFISRSSFEERAAAKCFLEWAEVHDHLYGTALDWVSSMESQGYHILFDIDVQGVRQAKAQNSPGAYIMLLPPDMVALERRLKGRGTEDSLSLATRLENAKKEMRCWQLYDYLVVNDRLEMAIADIESIISAERLRRQAVEGRLTWLSEIV